MNEPHDTIEPCCSDRVVVIDERHTGKGRKHGKLYWRGKCLTCGAERWYFMAKPGDPIAIRRFGDDPTYRELPTHET